MTRQPKNRVEIKKQGNIVEIRFIASSEDTANKLFDYLETFGIAAVKVDLEKEWEGDRNG